MAITSPFYTVSPRFAIHRGYLKGIALSWVPDKHLITDTPRLILAGDGVWSGQAITAIFKQEFWDWSSNTYTLDWILEDAYGQVAPDAPHIPVSFATIGIRYEASGNFYVAFDFFNFNDWTFKALPDSPTDWWVRTHK